MTQHRNRLDRLTDRRALRRQLTRAEVILWRALKSRQLEGHRFRRQVSVGSFIMDFFCPAANLAIELDGLSHDHDAAQAYDQARARFLAAHGIRTLRFTNDDVYRRLDDVLTAIAASFSVPSGKGR